MQEHLTMEVSIREERGKNAARRLRAAGKIPATLYGQEAPPESVALEGKAIKKLLASRASRNRVLELKGGVSALAMTVDYQVDPVTSRLLHVDLRRVDLTKTVEVTVQVITKGVSYGAKNQGAMEDVVLRELSMECLPEDAPEMIEIDVTALHAGDAIRVRDLRLGESVRVNASPDAMVVRCVGKKLSDIEEEEAEKAEETAATAEEKEKEKEKEKEE